MPRDTLLDFWRQPTPDGNWPTSFVFPTWRSEILSRLVGEIPLGPACRIMEVGCNCGRNLAHLMDKGYTNLEGVEISPYAVELLRGTYPQLAGTPIHVGAAEDVLPTRVGPYDLIFTMAVLEHIHPESTVVFDEMARLADTILAIEPAYGHTSTRQHPHDLQAIFEERGMVLTSTESLNGTHPDFADYAAWVFTTERTAA